MDEMHQKKAISQTVQKIIDFYMCVDLESETSAKIGQWLNNDEKSALMTMKLFTLYADVGWWPYEPIDFFESVEIDKLSKEIYERAMSYFKKHN